MTDPERVAAAAAACIGTPFRPQGRTPGVGLDCAGVIIVALAAVNRSVKDLNGYRLHGDFVQQVTDALHTAGCHPTSASQCVGDVLLFRVTPLQIHLGISSGSALIHAHAGVGHVVESPANPDWAAIARFRLGHAS